MIQVLHKECGEKFEEVWEQSLQYVSENLEKNTEVCNKIKKTTEDFLGLNLTDKQHIEVRNVVYKDLKNLLKLTE